MTGGAAAGLTPQEAQAATLQIQKLHHAGQDAAARQLLVDTLATAGVTLAEGADPAAANAALATAYFEVLGAPASAS